MFGYVTIAAGALAKERQERYRACYCGLCHTLCKRYGNLGRLTLSYDLTFLYLLLTSLYEPEEAACKERCLPHPIKPHAYVQNELCEYCADMNIALAYHKCLDDWQDDHSLTGRAEAGLLKSAYQRVSALYPEKCAEIERCLREISALEHDGALSPDAPANLTARMLGIVYRFREDMWADTLMQVGEALGRFVYLMDAYDDLPADLRKKRYNPLADYHDREDYESFVKEGLTMLVAECTEAFETLPLVKDLDILRNILYAGCWSRYQQKQMKRDRKKAKLEPPQPPHG
ncbi:MAG: DUF5685 family protein [Clostridia bacterium]